MPAGTCTIRVWNRFIPCYCNHALHAGNVRTFRALGRDGEKTVDPSVDVGAAAVKNVVSVTEAERPHKLTWTILDFWQLFGYEFD